MNTEDFVTYEQALALKKLGFDYNVDYYYSCTGINRTIHTEGRNFNSDENSDNFIISAPTLAQAQNG